MRTGCKLQCLQNPSALQKKLARVQVEHREFGDAERAIDAALRAYQPGALYGYLLRARISELKGDSTAAREQREKAETLAAQEMRKEKPEDQMIVPIALFVALQDDWDEIVRQYTGKDRLTQLDHATLASAYFQQGRMDDAVTEFRKACVGKDDTARGHFGLAELLKRARRLNEAAEQYRRAYEMDPANVTYKREFEDAQKQTYKP